MTGAVQATTGCAAAAGYGANGCIVNDVGGGVRRAGASGGGPITPNLPFKGATILQAECIGVTLGFRIYIAGTHAQTFFSKLVVQDTSGSFRTLTSASATAFSAGGGSTNWDWSVAGGTALVWPTAGGPFFLQLYP